MRLSLKTLLPKEQEHYSSFRDHIKLDLSKKLTEEILTHVPIKQTENYLGIDLISLDVHVYTDETMQQVLQELTNIKHSLPYESFQAVQTVLNLLYH